ncbi:MAG: SLBB domain-containing protein [Bacillota bacterium]|nr:SLBB domain-containing protein [Bacillota bacterium]
MQKDKKSRNLYTIIYIALIAVVGTACIIAGFYSSVNSNVKSDFESANAEEYIPMITVYVTGEVLNPGLYELEKGARATAAIEKAGGMTPNANSEGVNLAQVLDDGEQVKVPAIKTTAPASSAKSRSSVRKTTSKTTAKATSKAASVPSKTVEEKAGTLENTPEEEMDKKINLNCGDVNEYMKVNGVTKTVAENIAKFIGDYGTFKNIYELRCVDGVTLEIYNKINDKFVVE